MRNISVRIILAVLLVASLGCAKVMNCKTEWFPKVKELAPEFPWDKTRGGDIKKRPKRYLCAEFHTDEGNTVYAAIGKKDNELAIVHHSTGGWMASYFFDAGREDEMGFFAVDAYGIETYAFVPYREFARWKRLARTSIASDDCPDSWKTNGVCDPAWYSWGRN